MKKKSIVTKHKKGEWTFDDAAALNFDLIAEKNIPNYNKVIGKTVEITKKAFPKQMDIRIIDIGSATGKTLKKFYDEGYKNVYGVENSPSMIQMSFLKENVFLSEVFPKKKGKFDVVSSNWTLHFIKKREEYMKDVYKQLNKGGYFILTEKMDTNGLIHDLYHDFKKRRGVSLKEIERKRDAIEGVLVTKTLDWYLKTLKKIGFKSVEVVDADWCFRTLLCRK